MDLADSSAAQAAPGGSARARTAQAAAIPASASKFRFMADSFFRKHVGATAMSTVCRLTSGMAIDIT